MTNKSTTNYLLHNNLLEKVCEGFGCYEKITREIKVDAGKFRTLTLFLCTNCIGKFEND